MEWQVVKNDRFDRNSQQMVENEVAQKRIMPLPGKTTTTPPIPSTPNENNETENEKQVGD